MARQKGSGLDALFTKVFSDDSVKSTIASMHSDFGAPPQSSSVSDAPEGTTIADTYTVVSALSSTPVMAVSSGVETVTATVPNNQTNNQAINQAIKQANRQAIRQTDKQTSTITDDQTNKQTTGQTDKQSIQHFSHHLGSQSDNQSSNQTDGQSFEHSTHQTTEQSIRQLNRPISQTGRQIWLPLNENQGRLLLFLYEKGGGLTNMEIVVAETGIAYGTARAGIDVLIREGYVTYKARHNGHSFRGFEYSMNNHLCSLYAAQVRGEQNEQSTRQSFRQSSNQTNSQAVRQSLGQSSNQATAVVSSFLTDFKTTTAENPELETLLKDPELGYWREKGVNGRQINAWTEEFQMPVDQVLQSLRYCRYDMVILNQEEEKQISNPMNWFYKVMQRSGLYPKPAGYKSLAEIRAEQMEQAARDAAEARERQANAERELAFQKIMSDPNGHAYQSLLAQVNEFAREMGGKALEVALREVFDGVIHHTKGESP